MAADSVGSDILSPPPRPRRFLRPVAAIVIAGVIAVATIAVARLYPLLQIGTAYAAKTVCSGVFVSGRAPESVFVEDVAVDDLRVLRFARHSVDLEREVATVSFLGLTSGTAIHRPGFGCTLVLDFTEEEIRAQPVPTLRPSVRGPAAASPAVTAAAGPDTTRWLSRSMRVEEPETAAGHPGRRFDVEALERVLDEAFAEPYPEPGAEPGAASTRRTRSALVVQGGRIVAERYADGFDSEMPLLGWSMAKTVTVMQVGMLVGEGSLSVMEDSLFSAWTADSRSRITVDDLLRMTGGLEFEEVYTDPLADVTAMLLGQGASGVFAAGKPVAYQPGAHWAYSSGSTNALLEAIRRRMRARTGSDDAYWRTPRRLFAGVGLQSAVLELDASGTFVGSSFMYASPRDWARLGLLLLNDGVWEGRRLLPDGWVEYMTTPTPSSSDGVYGAHVWLGFPEDTAAVAEVIPEDAYYMLGHDGQIVAIVPSEALVVVRMGLSRYPEAWNHRKFLESVLNTLEPVETFVQTPMSR